jgi:stage II sporulation protein D
LLSISKYITKRFACFGIILFFALQVKGDNLLISILGEKTINSFSVKITRGAYSIKNNSSIYNLNKGDRLNIRSGLIVSLNDSVGFEASGFELIGHEYVNHFEILTADGHTYKYDDNLLVSMLTGEVQLMNRVDLDHYVAGVVEGEAGYGLPLEYYKLQAILCRTYGLKNINRHQSQGYNLCDKVHCQVYHNKCKKNDIIKATAATSGLVVVDHDLNLINTTFHSNCGGQTCNSEDVWVRPVSYLRSIKDSFCLGEPHSVWKKKINKEDFKTVFSKNNPIDSLEFDSVLNICQDTARFPHKKIISTKLTRVRSELGLRSTFFSIEPDSNQLLLFGKGFGHGVGLCQEGGIVMAKKEYSYVDILKFYYNSVFIVNQRAILFFKE